MSFSSCNGVRPAACSSPASGNEIFPSDRTGTDRVTSGSFQTSIVRWSSLPITKLLSCGLVADGGPDCTVAAATAGAGSETVAVPGPAPCTWAHSQPQTITKDPPIGCLTLVLITTPVDPREGVYCRIRSNSAPSETRPPRLALQRAPHPMRPFPRPLTAPSCPRKVPDDRGSSCEPEFLQLLQASPG